jgi:two-component system, NtrC family, sensor kinase
VLENRLVQADKLSSLGLLAAGVAHEVNTPLAVISTYAQMLAKQVNGDDSKARLLEKIAKQTFRASEIVNSLLNFSRTSSTSFEEIDLHKIVRETVQLVSPQMEKAGVRVLDELGESPGPVRGNSGKLQQVFLNLILNARDAMDGGGTLRLSAESTDSSLRIRIADSGCGISEADLARIYDPFFTTKTAKKGTGLGLSITYGIVKEHAGSIAVSSQPAAAAF